MDAATIKAFRKALKAAGVAVSRFDGIMTVCVFAWEERARESSLANLEEIGRRLGPSPLSRPRRP